MDFRVAVMLALSIFVSCSSGSAVIGPLQKEGPVPAPTQAPSNGAVTYKYRVMEEGEEFEEKITVDKDKQTETVHVDAHGDQEEADIISDFKRNLTMYRVPAQKICFLGPVEAEQKSPDELIEELATEADSAQARNASSSTTKWQAGALVKDRSVLSDEMANLCAKFPIYKIKKTNGARRAKRDIWCLCYYVRYCYGTWLRYCYVVRVCYC